MIFDSVQYMAAFSDIPWYMLPEIPGDGDATWARIRIVDLVQWKPKPVADDIKYIKLENPNQNLELDDEKFYDEDGEELPKLEPAKRTYQLLNFSL